MTLRNVQLPTAQDLTGDYSGPVLLELSLVEGEVLNLAAFYKGCTAMTGAKTQKFVLTDVEQVITLTPTDELFPQTWYLAKLLLDTGEQYFRFQVPSYVDGDEDPLTWETLIMIQDGVDRGEIGENRLLPKDPEDGDVVIYDGDLQEWVVLQFDPEGVGDMLAEVYDPNTKAVDLFLMANLEGTYDCGAV